MSRNKYSLLPDSRGLTTEVWLIVILFLYQLFNRIALPGYHAIKRHHKFIRARYESMARRFGQIVDSRVQDNPLKALVYAIMIYEDFNRPKLVRVVERLAAPFGLAKTLGIMQVKAKRCVSDKVSVMIGIDKILRMSRF